ncbi:hypothetical protein KGF48_16740 [Clostridioides sp. ZZV15-6388]|uniref:YczE/YyaS/YitT family protein n=1 Tax=Clostridioides sp. ZZV15-6388 TaxID=2811499 RepID=UPI001D11F9B6|nr:hypothetical protein [Clostridioides sp. ZZV15-6388]
MLQKVLWKFSKLVLGLFICSIGIVLTINCNLGLSPWDVFHQGLSNHVGITIGTASIIVGSIVVIADVILGENVGWGTVFNMLLIGFFMDLLLYTNLIPKTDSVLIGIIMLILGLGLVALGMVFYMGSGLGSGPRDGLMVALQKKTGKSLNLIRGTIEVGALIVGFFLGGKVGIGTIISAFGLGYLTQILFNLFKLDCSKIKHRFIIDDIKFIKLYMSGDKKTATQNMAK